MFEYTVDLPQTICVKNSFGRDHVAQGGHLTVLSGSCLWQYSESQK